jgi:hypothetical protein
MFIPKRGRLESTSGNRAQWIAQITEVATPSASQLTCNFMIKAKILLRNQVAKYIFATSKAVTISWKP